MTNIDPVKPASNESGVVDRVIMLEASNEIIKYKFPTSVVSLVYNYLIDFTL